MTRILDAEQKARTLKAGRLYGRVLPAGPGAATGRIAFSAERAVEMAKDDKVILVRIETSPEDIVGMHISAGILTTRGGLTSHPAGVARRMGRPCIVGAGALRVDYGNGELRAESDEPLEEGARRPLDGAPGQAIRGAHQT